MPHHRYSQFCPVARAAEILGERWTLLILRELAFGPKRFSDLRRGLGEVSPSILTERLGNLENLGLIRRTELEPPAASTVYELAENGLALKPAMTELAKWGARFLLPPRPGETMDPGWVRNVLALYARTSPVAECRVALRIQDDGSDTMIHIHGGSAGTVIANDDDRPDLVITGSGPNIIAALLGAVDLAAAASAGDISLEGDASKLALLPELFDVGAHNAPTSLDQPTAQK